MVWKPPPDHLSSFTGGHTRSASHTPNSSSNNNSNSSNNTIVSSAGGSSINSADSNGAVDRDQRGVVLGVNSLRRWADFISTVLQNVTCTSVVNIKCPFFAFFIAKQAENFSEYILLHAQLLKKKKKKILYFKAVTQSRLSGIWTKTTSFSTPRLATVAPSPLPHPSQCNPFTPTPTPSTTKTL
jgi:hypothetical protein